MRRKSAYLNWTLVLLVIVLCPSVYTRPQDTSSVKTEIATESSIRYSYRNDNLSLSYVPLVINFVQNSSNKNVNELLLNHSNRTNKMIKGIASNIPKHKINRNSFSSNIKPAKVKLPELSVSYEKRRPNIKKVLTKWKDETKYEDLNFSHETTTSSEERDPLTTVNIVHTTSTESLKSSIQKQYYPSTYNNYRPNFQPQYSEETQLYSTNIQIVDSHTPRPSYLYTKRPSPTPIITNVGYPTPWQQNSQIYRKTTTRKPVLVTNPFNHNNYNSIHNYGEFEVTTFQPTSAYTDRIVIRPEEYSGSPDECPTIYLTLNNTFQGQAKEACPDLNIAVNTNVINKNVVIDSEEEEPESLFPGAFGLPIGDEDESNADDSNPDLDESSANDYFGGDTTENQAVESDSIEGSELSNYNAANAIQSQYSEQGGLFSPSNHASAISKPGRPNKDDDDIFSLSSLVQFFRPAISALGWLSSVNPFTIGLFPLFLAPIAFLFAGSGIAALFSPWFLPIGREAPKVVHVYRPYWHWDDKIKTWHLHSFPDNRNGQYSARSSKEEESGSVKQTFFYKLKEVMKITTNILRERNKSGNSRKSRRRKRDIWSLRIK